MILACRRQICHSRYATLLSASGTRYIGADEKIEAHFFIRNEILPSAFLRAD